MCPGCGRSYKHRQSLHKHQKGCVHAEADPPSAPGSASGGGGSNAELLKVNAYYQKEISQLHRDFDLLENRVKHMVRVTYR